MDKYKNKIKYLGLGVEVNNYQDYDNYLRNYNLLYDAVKDEFSDINVFPIFQYEYLRGLKGGLFGGVNDENKARWNLIQNINSDFIGFTTYPGLIYKSPDEIPEDYYLKIESYANKPIIFTEIGWFSEGPAGWESSDDEQARFIQRYFELTKDLDVRVNIWLHLYEQEQAQEPFKKMSLLSGNEETSAGFEAWNVGN